MGKIIYGNVYEHGSASTMGIGFPMEVVCCGYIGVAVYLGIGKTFEIYSGNAKNIFKTKQYINVKRRL